MLRTFASSLRPASLTALGACLFGAALCLAPASAQSQWTVDAAGGGDFTSLQTAVNQAAPGDVLLVQPGNYGGVVVGKRLRILGNPAAARPVTTIFRIENASSVTLSHFQVAGLRVEDVNGRAVIEDCTVGTFGIVIQNCPHVLLSRTTVTAGGTGEFATSAVIASNSRVQVVGCNLTGGTSTSPWSGTVGGDGLRLTHGSQAWISASNLRGGDGVDQSFPSSAGDGGHALALWGGSSADVRGGPQHVLEGGKQIGTLSSGSNGWSIQIFGGSATASGVTLIGWSLEVQPHAVLPAPFLDVAGTQGPGEVFEAHLYGGAGELAVLVAGLVPSHLELPSLLSTPLWVDPAHWIALAPLVLQGLDTPAVFSVLQPPTAAFAGRTLYMQGAQLLPSGNAFGTNAGALVLDW